MKRRFFGCTLAGAVCAYVFAMLLGSCGGSPSGSMPPPNSTPAPLDHIYDKATTKLIVEIDYQNGATPYTGPLLGASSDTWDVLSSNAARLFQGSGKSIEVPRTLAQMEALSDVSGNTFTADQILAIAQQHRNQQSVGDVASFYVVFLNGYYNDGKKTRMDVLGVTIGDTAVIGMFKPVIESSTVVPTGQKLVEQSTLVHEFGHAVGLVNNGVAPTKAHQDTANGNHCANTKCVMYYANEGVATLMQFASQIRNGDEVLFDADCLNDVAARMNQPK